MSKRPPARNLTRKTAFKRFFTTDVVTMEPASLRHDGYTPVIEREMFCVGDVAVILLYDPQRDEILLNQQFRVGPFLMDDEDPFLFECAAGLVDKGEDPLEAAIREALEETGSTVTETESVGFYYPSPGGTTERHHLFIGRIANPEAGLHGLAHETEEIKTHVFPAQKVIEMLDTGIIRNAATVIAVHWFARNHDRLRKKWGAA